ncbi:hypothetical protein [Kutzneria chonburiensis]|uniref:Uncharacterized protein n=1 Tax=Kutzneria chonburiensis TaxID=1483604 RepID=A0ABV6N2Z1_9PSEU|nr:hypothetical protein [Kutzneria chonburiensis]
MFDDPSGEWPSFATKYEQPRAAWLKTGQFLPEDPDASYRPDPDGLTAQYDVPALVHGLLPSHYGSKIAIVSFQLITESKQWGWTATEQLVPTRYLQRRISGRQRR